MSEEIIKVLDELGNKFGIAIDWSNKNIVPYLQDLMTRFISFKNAQAIIWVIISLIVIGLSIFGIIKLTKWNKSDEFNKYDEDMVFVYSFLYAICMILIFAFLITATFNINGLFQNIFIPELSIIDYIQGRE